jgi:hypothetical protein
MAYEVEAIVSDFASSTPQTVWRPERTVDFSEFSPPKKSAPTPFDAHAITEQPKAEPAMVEPQLQPEITLSPAAAALARREQRFRKQQAEFREQQLALENERKEIAELRELKRKLAAKDFSGIENDVPYDAYTNYLIEKSAGSSPEQDEIKQLRSDVKSMQDAQKSDLDRRFEAAVQQRREAIKTIIESNPEFSSVKELDAAEHVVQHIIDTFEEEGVELTPEQALQDVENVIVKRAQKWSGLTKVRPKEEPKKEEVKVESKRELPPLKKPAVTTITNSMAATGDLKSTKRNYASLRSDEERWAAARNAVLASGEILKG